MKKMLAAGIVSLVAMGSAGAANAAAMTVDFHGGSLTISSAYGGWYYDGWHNDRNRHDHTLSPKQVRNILKDRGYRNIDYFDTRGTTYQARATDYRGRRVVLVVNAKNARIITAYRVH
jgi:hypothetical protein